LGGRFDITLSRAFSDLRTFLVLSLPFLKGGGMVIAMKGKVDNNEMKPFTETEESPYRFQKNIFLTLPFSSFERTILLFEKI
jgi:16S rRNA G527 N7-methylase RsmG